MIDNKATLIEALNNARDIFTARIKYNKSVSDYFKGCGLEEFKNYLVENIAPGCDVSLVTESFKTEYCSGVMNDFIGMTRLSIEMVQLLHNIDTEYEDGTYANRLIQICTLVESKLLGETENIDRILRRIKAAKVDKRVQAVAEKKHDEYFELHAIKEIRVLLLNSLNDQERELFDLYLSKPKTASLVEGDSIVEAQPALERVQQLTAKVLRHSEVLVDRVMGINRSSLYQYATAEHQLDLNRVLTKIRTIHDFAERVEVVYPKTLLNLIRYKADLCELTATLSAIEKEIERGAAQKAKIAAQKTKAEADRDRVALEKHSSGGAFGLPLAGAMATKVDDSKSPADSGAVAGVMVDSSKPVPMMEDDVTSTLLVAGEACGAGGGDDRVSQDLLLSDEAAVSRAGVASVLAFSVVRRARQSCSTSSTAAAASGASNTRPEVVVSSDLLERSRSAIVTFLSPAVNHVTFRDFTTLIHSLGGKISSVGGSHFKIQFQDRTSSYITVGGGFRPHGKGGHTPEIRGYALKLMRDTVLRVLPSTFFRRDECAMDRSGTDETRVLASALKLL